MIDTEPRSFTAADRERLQALATDLPAAAMFDQLADAYELLLLDLGAPPVARLADLVEAARIDALYLVCDSRALETPVVRLLMSQLAERRIFAAGAIANFAELTTSAAAPLTLLAHDLEVSTDV